MPVNDVKAAGGNSEAPISERRKIDDAQSSKKRRTGAAGESVTAAESWVCVMSPSMRARILYPNPVCFLLTGPPPLCGEGEQGSSDWGNAMVISWLTPINNKGALMLSINRRRFSAEQLLNSRRFALAVPTAGMETVLLGVGSCSGRDGEDKFSAISGLSWRDVVLAKVPKKFTGGASVRVLQGCVAHLECAVRSVDTNSDPEHYLVVADMTACFVNEAHWNGRQLTAPCLTFLGSKRFGTVRAQPEPEASS